MEAHTVNKKKDKVVQKWKLTASPEEVVYKTNTSVATLGHQNRYVVHEPSPNRSRDLS